ncbi:ABC transporter permease subunit [Oceanobacillus sojae]|uniref:ABC transporter permease subunit n=1 Tax=Oceanobacillus sojae TaxID=582851 RepID=UPI00098887BC|nr:ABC transporter permease subunit [Oceanobacillus sojae]MCT1901416.1 ABC transporter permease subunit [Oceanobacillus sojae]
MKNIYYFSKKEFLESWRTSRLLILMIIFLILGIMNPLIAILTPDIIQMSFGDSLPVNIPEPTSLDSWGQFYQNMTQMGLIVITLLFSGTMSGEVSKGTLINLVTKGLKRSTVVISKSIYLILQWSFCMLLAFFVTWAYTLYYFTDDNSPHVFLAVFPLWIFGILLITTILLTSTVSKNSYEGLLLTGGFVVLLFVMNIFDKFERYNPITLTSENINFLQGASNIGNYMPAMLISFFLSLLFIYLSIVILNKKKL